jgi:arylsulfatase A-like enzyme
MGAHGFVMHGSPALYDPVMRVPYLVRWPGVAPKGAVCDAFISHVDLLPTLAQVAGAVPPPTHGRSFLPLLRGVPGPDVPSSPSFEDRRDDVYAQYSGDGIQFYSVRAVRSRERSYTFAPHGGEELYDLRADPDERCNRASDPAAAAGLREMRARLAERMERIDDPLRGTSIWRATVGG